MNFHWRCMMAPPTVLDYIVGLAGLYFIAPDPTSGDWLAIYRYWAGMNGEA